MKIHALLTFLTCRNVYLCCIYLHLAVTLSCKHDMWMQRGRVNEYNKEMYLISFWMYVSDWSALFYLVEAVRQALGRPTIGLR